jgi:hypothetical protein
MAQPVVTFAGGKMAVQIGQWGYTYDAAEVKEALIAAAKLNRSHNPDEILAAIAREVIRQGVNLQEMTNAQIRSFIQTMEF